MGERSQAPLQDVTRRDIFEVDIEFKRRPLRATRPRDTPRAILDMNLDISKFNSDTGKIYKANNESMTLEEAYQYSKNQIGEKSQEIKNIDQEEDLDDDIEVLERAEEPKKSLSKAESSAERTKRIRSTPNYEQSRPAMNEDLDFDTDDIIEVLDSQDDLDMDKSKQFNYDSKANSEADDESIGNDLMTSGADIYNSQDRSRVDTYNANDFHSQPVKRNGAPPITLEDNNKEEIAVNQEPLHIDSLNKHDYESAFESNDSSLSMRVVPTSIVREFFIAATPEIVDSLTLPQPEEFSIQETQQKLKTSINMMTQASTDSHEMLVSLNEDISKAHGEIYSSKVRAEEIKEDTRMAIDKLDGLAKQMMGLANTKVDIKIVALEHLLRVIALIYYVVSLVWTVIRRPFKKGKIKSFKDVQKYTRGAELRLRRLSEIESTD